MIRFFLLATLFFAINHAQAQVNTSDNTDGLVATTLSYGFQLPGADLAKDYGNSFQVGMNVEWMTKNNLIMGLQGLFFWGGDVKNDVLAGLRGPNGNIPTSQGSVTTINLKERGQYFGAHAGKLFLLSSNFRGGIRVTLGGGYFRHKVRLQEDFQVEVPQLFGEYKKGYDQLMGGLALKQFVGYQLLSRNGLINFIVGVEITEGFTASRRSWDFPTNSVLEDKRFDLLSTLLVGWTLPIYFESQPEKIFY